MKSTTLQLMTLLIVATLVVCKPSSAFAQTTIYRPTISTPCCPTCGWHCYQNPTNAFDGISSSYAQANVAGLRDTQGVASTTWYGFSNATGTRTSLKLRITSSAIGNGDQAQINVSLDGGVHFGAPIYIASNRPQQTDDIILPVSQDLTKVQIYGQVIAPPMTGGQHNIFEIWIEVTH